ncbi:MAG: YihY/virulence factor BrkB family protein [Hyphomicrobiaceae bacterium TMED74]|nr:ribonuclease BN [Filomicrobium sp.]RPG41932.1 MAG: YihY/virulence factor BrkB family protein [Hyphomicrobiaceae bacterium TMED74]
MNSKLTILGAIYRLYEHSQFSMAGAVAFSFLVSIFPFCILLGALAGILGGPALAETAIGHLFKALPGDVAKGLVPQVESIMTSSRIDLLTIGGAITLFFATSAIETLRTALNFAYRVQEKRPYIVCLGLSMLNVFVAAIVLLILAWTALVAPSLATMIKSQLLSDFLNSSWVSSGAVYALTASVIALQLFAIHLWLAAGRRRLADVWPGIVLTILLWMLLGTAYSYYLGFSNYSRFYAGLSQIMIALIFFQVTAVAIILGAELNRGLIELKKMRNGNGSLLKKDGDTDDGAVAT